MSLHHGCMKGKKQKKRIHRSGADEGQESVLWQSRIDWHMRIVEDYISNIKPPFQNTLSLILKICFVESQLSALSQESCLLQIIQSKVEVMYSTEQSQWKIQWSFRWSTQFPPCQFILQGSKSKTGDHLSSGLWCHSCSANDHVISTYKSPALDCNFLARYFLQQIMNGETSQIQLPKNNDSSIGMQCFIINHRTCIGNCYLEIAIQWTKEIQLNLVL